MSTEQQQYFDYLMRRSRLGHWYRRYWLYPALCRQLHGRVLDVGCGIGDMLRYRPDTLGVDINPSTVEFCKQQGLDARLMEPDILPFSDGKFDGVVLDNVLEHLAAPAPLLAEARRVLRADGIFVVGVPGPRGYASDPDHKVFYDESRLVSTLDGAGFGWRRTLRMPLPFEALGSRLRSYCIYGIFARR